MAEDIDSTGIKIQQQFTLKQVTFITALSVFVAFLQLDREFELERTRVWKFGVRVSHLKWDSRRVKLASIFQIEQLRVVVRKGLIC